VLTAGTNVVTAKGSDIKLPMGTATDGGTVATLGSELLNSTAAPVGGGVPASLAVNPVTTLLPVVEDEVPAIDERLTAAIEKLIT
jgi:hypothetical protein